MVINDMLYVSMDSISEQGYQTTDFKEVDGIATRDLEACTAVVTYSSQQGMIAHLTNVSNLNKFYNWLKGNVKRGTKAFIVGGVDGKSEDLVKNLESNIISGGYDLQGVDVLGENQRHIKLNKEGSLGVEYFKQWMDGSRQLQELQVGLKSIDLS